MKMDEVMKDRGVFGGDNEYFTVDDVLGAEIMITEALTPTSDIREHVTEKKDGKDGKDGNEPVIYLCLGVRHRVDKDLHCTRACMREIAIRMQSVPQWQGQLIRINRTGKGFDTRYTITHIGMVPGGYVASSVPVTVPGKPGKDDPANPAILTMLKKSPGGMLDRVFWVAAQTEEPDMGTCMATVDRMKKEGKIVYHKGTWMAT